jgi:hypothetical protein
MMHEHLTLALAPLPTLEFIVKHVSTPTAVYFLNDCTEYAIDQSGRANGVTCNLQLLTTIVPVSRVLLLEHCRATTNNVASPVHVFLDMQDLNVSQVLTSSLTELLSPHKHIHC